MYFRILLISVSVLCAAGTLFLFGMAMGRSSTGEALATTSTSLVEALDTPEIAEAPVSPSPLEIPRPVESPRTIERPETPDDAMTIGKTLQAPTKVYYKETQARYSTIYNYTLSPSTHYVEAVPGSAAYKMYHREPAGFPYKAWTTVVGSHQWEAREVWTNDEDIVDCRWSRNYPNIINCAIIR